MATKKYISLSRLEDYDAKIKGVISTGDNDTLSSAQTYTDTKVANITSGTTVVAKAEEAVHSESADTATKADSATHATSADSATTATNANHATSADSATTATKLGSTTVGSTNQPIYLNSGTATKISAVGTSYGGTGATTVAGARTNLDVYSKSEVDGFIEDTKVFYVTVTGDETNGYTADKTFSEINEAHVNGKSVYCKLINDGIPFLLPLLAIAESMTTTIFGGLAGNEGLIVTYTPTGIAVNSARLATSDVLESHTSDTSNPHNVTKSQIGLGNVDNTSDANKPVSTAQATAIADAKKAGTDAQSALDIHTANTNNPHGVTTSQIGAVPTTRTINGKALSSNITLSASDVGADASGSASSALTNAKSYTDSSLTNYYTKTQIDSMEFITTDDIDTICGTTIQVATANEVTF